MPKRMKVEGGQTSEEVDAVYQRGIQLSGSGVYYWLSQVSAKADTYRSVSTVLSGTESYRETLGSGEAPRC